MERLFWVGVGVAGALVAARKWQELRSHSPAAELVAKAGGVAADRFAVLGSKALGQVKVATVRFLDDFRVARDERNEQLADALLAPSQGSEADLRARRARVPDSGSAPGGVQSSSGASAASPDEFAGDEAALGYEF